MIEYAPERIGRFKLYPPVPPKLGGTGNGWGLADETGWLPLMLADRDACLMVIGMILAGLTEEDLEKLRDRYNRARPIVNVTTEHLIAYGERP